MERLRIFAILILLAIGLVPFTSSDLRAQEIVFTTVDRAPFSMEAADGRSGFSIDLMEAIAAQMGRPVRFEKAASFSEMLDLVEAGSVDGAIANISITSAREERIDFSQPIFRAGIKVLVPDNRGRASLFQTLFTWDILIAVLIAIALLFGGGFLMWLFERNKQPYFDRPVKEAIFPAFWWALNLVVNGGFEERVPQSRPGRFFAVVLVISSLFLVSVFVANITAAATVEALQDSVGTINDLEGRRVGTIDGSTAASLLRSRELEFIGFADPEALFQAFEEGDLDALVFDAPILAYYASSQESGKVRLLERNYRPENYGIALPTGSPLKESIDQALLGLREAGTYDDLVEKWFGSNYTR